MLADSIARQYSHPEGWARRSAALKGQCSVGPRIPLRTLPREPSPHEPGPAQAPHDVGIAAHQPPDELRAVVFGHREDGALVNAQVVDVEPAGGARLGERGVEGVAEAV